MYKPTFYSKYIKRLLDIVLSLLAIVLLGWLMIIVAILVRIKIGSPVLFKHQRPGKNEVIFNMLKFRTMRNAYDASGRLLPDEERLIPFGIKLRATSLDELPELFLILTGKMSFVGPRPLEVYFLPYYSEREHHRHDVLPGLTGLAQVNGRNNLSWEEKFEYDLKYVSNITFWNDLKIMFKTFFKVFAKEGVVETGGAAIEDFNIERQRKWDLEKKQSNVEE